jgi:arsenate reductase
MSRYNVLFLCTGNSAHSIMAEAIMNRRGLPNFTAFSAGSHPVGVVRPEALRQIQNAGLNTANLRSKSWDEYSEPGAPPLHFVFTVCDNAAKEVCPFWPGQPMTAHWGVLDPAAIVASPEQIDRAFSQAFSVLERRINLFLCLPLATLDTFALQREIDNIGKQQVKEEKRWSKSFLPVFITPAAHKWRLRFSTNLPIARMQRRSRPERNPVSVSIPKFSSLCRRSELTSAMPVHRS